MGRIATVGAFDAKTHLSSLLDRVERGEEVVITRRGKAVARLVPITSGHDVAAAREAVAALRQLREELAAEGVGATQDEIRTWIGEGRR